MSVNGRRGIDSGIVDPRGPAYFQYFTSRIVLVFITCRLVKL